MRLDRQTAHRELKQLLEEERLIVFAGSGVSVAQPSGLPTWDDFMVGILDWCRDLQSFLLQRGEIDPSAGFTDDLLDDAKKVVHERPEQVASVIRHVLGEISHDAHAQADNQFRQWLSDRLMRNPLAPGGPAIALPNRNHKAIVNTNYPLILTTNFDTLLEDAARSEAHKTLAFRTTSFNDPDQVASLIFRQDPGIVHVHGDRSDIMLRDFVFTAEDYVRLRHENRGIDICLHGLFLRYSVLFVGYGASDPHLEQFIEDIAHFLRRSSKQKRATRGNRYYLVLRTDKVNRVLERHKERLQTSIIAAEDWEDVTLLLEQLQKVAPRQK